MSTDDATYLPFKELAEHTLELLSKDGAKEYTTLLKEQIAKELKSPPLNSDVDLLILITSHPTDKLGDHIQSLFMIIRSTLETALYSNTIPEHNAAMMEAAAALFNIAACLAVNLAFYEQRIKTPDKCRYNLQIPFPTKPTSNEPDFDSRSKKYSARIKLICSIIAASIYGGKVVFSSNEDSDKIHQPEHAYLLDSFKNGDDITANLESALYSLVFYGTQDAPAIAYDSKLPDDMRSALLVRIMEIKKIQKICPVIAIDSTDTDIFLFIKFADEYGIPVMSPGLKETSELLHLKPDILISHFERFWDNMDKEKPTTSISNDTSFTKNDLHDNNPNNLKTIDIDTITKTANDTGKLFEALKSAIKPAIEIFKMIWQ